ncbi:MAG: biotin-dependent carboxyltransferase family protein [Suipraeoptans sp.]
MGIYFRESGILTTIQDAGRFGYQQFGVSPAGPMDTKAFNLANILVGNKRSEGALEITFLGPTIVVEEDNIFAVTGGELSPTLNDENIPMYTAILAKAGDEIKFGMAGANGCRAYLSFAGGLDVPEVMGSKATLLRNKLGGLDGRAIKKEDRIGFVNPKSELQNMESRHLPIDIYPIKETVLRVITGPQDGNFSKEELRNFFWYGAEITNEFDRMGCRLERVEPLKHSFNNGNIMTDGIAFGSIQVPSNGQPIIMLADRQSTGGYAKIGNVISVDLPKLAQSKPGYKVRFVSVSIELAQQLYNRQLKEINDYDNKLNSEE